MQPASTAIEIRGAALGLLDDPLLLGARGAGEEAARSLLWRARFRDDDGRVWQASAETAEGLAGAWTPAKATTGPLAALQSLRPVSLDVHVEATDGRGAKRTLSRALVGEGVRIRRWREPGLLATLHLPAGASCATVAIDATAGPHPAAVAALAAPLLASRGVLTLVVPASRDHGPAAETLPIASARLASVPGAASEPVVLRAVDPFDAAPSAAGDSLVVLPPGVAARGEDGAVAARAAAWDALLAGLGARPRALS
ncbi:MAG TPA: hypothetical protein VFF79_18105 [Conexibacter sp.]|nr:hypothetical protein [Conexibacter sp.]